MTSWLTGGSLGIVAAKATLMYILAVLGLRTAQRRTLAQWTAIDFVAAVAVGATAGRTAIAAGQSFAVGGVALVTFLALHWVVNMARYSGAVAKLVDHRVRVLVDHGRLRTDQLRVCGLTENDVLAKLREKGVGSVAELRYVLYETKGELTLVREDETGAGDPELVQVGLHDAAGWPP